MRYIIILILLIVAALLLGSYAFDNSADVVITWGDWGSISLTSTSFIIAIIVGFLAIYFLIALFRFFYGLRRRINNHKHKKLSTQANQELIKGLVHFTEGHWQQSEKTLLNHVAYAETPLLNYLVAARAAHMQESYKRRDKYLKKASELGEEAQTAVSVSQAEMQLASGQFEQARATLIHLLEVSPKHPYAIKLLAKIYFQQEDWSNLFSLLPELNKQSLIKEHERSKYEATALSGIFMTLAHKKDLHKMQTLWKKLPADIRLKSEAILVYCEALSIAGDSKSSDKLLIAAINDKWDEKLIERYGLIKHKKLGSAIKRAEKWLDKHQNSPQLLLALARLNKKYKLWGKAKANYNTSLNLSPAASVYLEFAELLEELDEKENAQICYKLGLKYTINKKGKILKLKPARKADSAAAVTPDIDEANFSI